MVQEFICASGCGDTPSTNSSFPEGGERLCHGGANDGVEFGECYAQSYLVNVPACHVSVEWAGFAAFACADVCLCVCL